MSWKQLKENIDKTLLGATTVIVFFILQFSWFLTQPQDPVPVWVVHALVILFYICCVFIYAVCKSKTVQVQYRLPRVLTVSGSGADAILVLEKSELFSYHMVVTIYQQKSSDDLEIPIAIGIVQAINQQGHPQIQLTEVLEQDIVQSVFPARRASPLSNKWGSIYVKPAILQEYLERRARHE